MPDINNYILPNLNPGKNFGSSTHDLENNFLTLAADPNSSSLSFLYRETIWPDSIESSGYHTSEVFERDWVIRTGGAGSSLTFCFEGINDLKLNGGLWTTSHWNKSLEIRNAGVIKWAGNQNYSYGIGQTEGGMFFMRGSKNTYDTSSDPEYWMIANDDRSVAINANSGLNVTSNGHNFALAITNNYSGTASNSGQGLLIKNGISQAVGASSEYNILCRDLGNITSFFVTSSGVGFLRGSLTQNSDGRLKENIKSIENGLQIIKKLNPVNYNFISHKDFKSGFVAQEVSKVLSHIVYENKEDDNFSIDYISIIPYLTKGIQEQQAILEEKDKQIQNLEARLKAIEEKLGI